MGNKGVIHVFIGAPVISPSLSCGMDRPAAGWKDVAFIMQDACIPKGGIHLIADELPHGGLPEKTRHGHSACDGVPEGPFVRTSIQSDLGPEMVAHRHTEIISDLVSSTELFHITHSLQKPLGREGDEDYDCIEETQDLHAIESDACRTISAETEFLTVLTSSQLAVRSPENDGTEVADDSGAGTSGSVRRGVVMENITMSYVSQEGFTCSSVLFTDSSDEELDQKSLRPQKSWEGPDQTFLQSQKNGDNRDQISIQSQKSKKSVRCQKIREVLDQKASISQRSEKLDQKSLQSHRSCEELDQKSTHSHQSGKEFDQTSMQSRKGGKGLLQEDSAIELSDAVDYLGSPSSKRKKAISGSSPSSTHEQQSKKSKPSISPVKFSMKSHNKHRQQTPAKSLTLLKHCTDKNKQYDIMVVVLQPCHVKEIKVKSGLNIGSTFPLATIVVMDQSEVKREVLMWRAAAFWGLALLPGEIIVLTNVTVCEDRWREDMVLQSSFRSTLTNLGSCSALLSGEKSLPVEFSAAKALLNYIGKKHHYLSELSPRQPQRLDHIQYVSLTELQPELLLHSTLKVNSISVLKESTYSYKGLQQNKIILTVEQVKGHTRTLVLWGTCVSWYDQIHLKRDHIWIFRYLFCKKNINSGDLELHTTPWSSCECLFDDDQRAVEFRKRYNVPSAKPMSLSSMMEERYSGEIQVKGRILQMEFHIPGKRRILISQKTSLSDILELLPDVVYTGCGKCRRELSIDQNNVYEQCYVCLPFNQIRAFYRSAQMTIMSDDCSVRVQVPPDVIENMLLNIAPNLLPKVFPTSTDVTYGRIVADLCHSLLAQTGESFVFTIRSQFMLDENSIPLEEDFHLVDFHLDLI
ncbi:shieldin complex subunit 2 [Dendropsophus ebraccatus]|uniref:shieldin complex subunit 2 n=1 Tax=Dendropsophus ebraccatus TaxID=150705 RepID=UPI0038310952